MNRKIYQVYIYVSLRMYVGLTLLPETTICLAYVCIDIS